MAHDKNKVEKEIIKIIEKEKIYNIKTIFAFYSTITRATFYDWDFDKIDTIKKALDDNKEKDKQNMLLKWVKSDNPTLQISAFKLLGDDEERKKLSQSYHDHTTKGDQINPVQLTPDQIDKIIEKL